MLQRAEDTSQEQFLKDVKALNLRSPVARLSTELKFNKSSVSKYLSGKAMPSKQFLIAFYDWLKKGGANVSHGNLLSDTEPPRYTQTFGEPLSPEEIQIISLRDQLKRADDQIRLLEKNNAYLEDELKKMLKQQEINFETSLKNQQELLAQLKAGIFAAARRYAGSDKKKLQAEMEYIYNTAGVALGQGAHSGTEDGN